MNLFKKVFSPSCRVQKCSTPWQLKYCAPMVNMIRNSTYIDVLHIQYKDIDWSGKKEKYFLDALCLFGFDDPPNRTCKTPLLGYHCKLVCPKLGVWTSLNWATSLKVLSLIGSTPYTIIIMILWCNPTQVKMNFMHDCDCDLLTSQHAKYAHKSLISNLKWNKYTLRAWKFDF